MNLNEIFANNLKSYIRKAGKTQAQVADAVNVSKGTFSDWTRARALPRMNKIEALAEYFGITKADLLEEKNPETNSYFLNVEVKELAQELYNNPEARALFSASRKLNAKDMRTVKALIDSLIE